MCVCACVSVCVCVCDLQGRLAKGHGSPRRGGGVRRAAGQDGLHEAGGALVGLLLVLLEEMRKRERVCEIA